MIEFLSPTLVFVSPALPQNAQARRLYRLARIAVESPDTKILTFEPVAEDRNNIVYRYERLVDNCFRMLLLSLVFYSIKLRCFLLPCFGGCNLVDQVFTVDT